MQRAETQTFYNVELTINGIRRVNNVKTSPNARSLEVVNVNEIIAEILGLLRFNAEVQHTEIAFEPEEEESLYLGVRDEMKQVILNLIKNSLDAMPEGGRITIRTSEDRSAGRVVLAFSDTGPGIQGDDPSHIFLPFYSTKTDRPGNLGLGLSISYRIIERANGTMRVENLPERGCRFTITLPAFQPDASLAASTDAADS